MLPFNKFAGSSHNKPGAAAGADPLAPGAPANWIVGQNILRSQNTQAAIDFYKAALLGPDVALSNQRLCSARNRVCRKKSRKASAALRAGAIAGVVTHRAVLLHALNLTAIQFLLMSKETKFGYGFLLVGIGGAFLIDKLFGAGPSLLIAAFCLLVGIALLVAGHRDDSADAPVDLFGGAVPLKEVARPDVREQPATAAPAGSAQPDDVWLALLERRQELEAELQPLLEIEECGIKVVPALKVGKDEADFRREQIARLRRDIEEIGKRLSSQLPSAAAGHPITRDWAKEWKDLAAAFREIARHRIRADWLLSSAGESWNLTGGANEAAKRVQSLCKQAGDLLLASPKISATVRTEVASHLPAYRWRFYVKANTHSFQHTGYGIETLEGGGQFNMMTGTITHVAEVSANLCMECAGEEY